MLAIQALYIAPLVFAQFDYIVKLKPIQQDLAKRDNSNITLQKFLSKHDGNTFVESQTSKITYEYNFNNFMGFAVKASPEAIKEIKADRDVEYWVHDGPMELLSPSPSMGYNETMIPWNLDRIDQRSLPLDNKFKAFGNEGEGVTVYVIDTGIDATHPDFEGRAIAGPSFVFGEFREPTSNNTDFHGHGTHCAGTIASKTYGVHQNLPLWVYKSWIKQEVPFRGL